MATGAQVTIAFSFGVLEAKDRKFRFTFDCTALCGKTAAKLRAGTSGGEEGEVESSGEWEIPPTNR